MKTVLSFLWKTIGGGHLERLLKTVFGDKAASNGYAHNEAMAAQEQFSKEFSYKGDRTWFDSLVDGLNRLPRPFMAFGVLGLFVSAMYDPIWFSSRMVALQAVPDWMAVLIGSVVLFFFGAREMTKHRSFKAKSSEEVGQILTQMREIKSLENESGAASVGDTSTGNSVVDEWKRKQPS